MENNEFQKIQDAREYAECIIDTVREPLVVLDAGLKVISVSRSFCDTFKVKQEETIGRLIYDLGNRQWDVPELRELLESVLPKSASFENFEVEHDFPDLGKRTMLLNARQIARPSGKPGIILLAIDDITESKKILDGLREQVQRLGVQLRTAAGREHATLDLKRKIDELEKRVLRKRA